MSFAPPERDIEREILSEKKLSDTAKRLREAFESQPLPQPLYIFNIQSSTTDSTVSSSPAPQQAQPRQPPPAMDLF